jgi:5S rRNA maturation endonuclease (ribonuclease M5)
VSGPGIDFNSAPRLPAASQPQDDARRLEILRSTLKARAAELVRELFPAARFQGNEARIGDAQGAPGESMSIQLSGDKAGQWYDHNPKGAEREGDLITLWRMGQGYDGAAGFWQAVADLEQHLGIGGGPKWTGAVARVAAERAKAPSRAEVTKELEATYVYTAADGAAVLAQVLRYRLSDGGKTFIQRNAAGEFKAPEIRPLYRLPKVAADDWVVLVEGEKCAEALEAIGVTATTAMGGSGAPLEKTDWSPLAGKRVILWPDNDEAGRAYMERVASHLRALGCDVSTVDIPAGAPPKWDAADARDAAEALAVLKTADRAVAPAPAAGRAMRLMSIAELRQVRKPEWLLENMIPAACFAEVIGPPASLKSFFVIQAGLCIAMGRPWLGRVVKQGPVVYVAGEGQAGASTRVVGYVEAAGGDDAAPFYVLPQSVAMPTGQLDEFLALVRSMEVPPVLIILDTLARSFGPGDENSSTDMGAFVKACDRLREETGACVLVVHHTGKDVSKGGRGSSALLGAVDCAIACERKAASVTLMNRAPYGKQKDAAEFDDIALTYAERKFDMGGEEASTLILIPDESVIATDPDETPKVERQRRLGGVEAKVMAALTRARGEPMGPARVHGMACPFDPDEGKAPHDMSAVNKALERMAEAGSISFRGPKGQRQYWVETGGAQL